MYKYELDNLLKRNVLTQEEYNEFFKSMSVDEKGQMIGVVPNGKCSEKYHFDGDLLGDNLLDFVINNVTPPYGSESFDDTFKTYGMMVCGIADYWHWFRKDNITDQAIKHGHKPIEEATEVELWKMIAIASRYWQVFYERIYNHEKGYTW